MTEIKKEEYRGFEIRVVMVNDEYKILLLRDGLNAYAPLVVSREDNSDVFTMYGRRAYDDLVDFLKLMIDTGKVK